MTVMQFFKNTHETLFWGEFAKFIVYVYNICCDMKLTKTSTPNFLWYVGRLQCPLRTAIHQVVFCQKLSPRSIKIIPWIVRGKKLRFARGRDIFTFVIAALHVVVVDDHGNVTWLFFKGLERPCFVTRKQLSAFALCWYCGVWFTFFKL